MSTEQEILVTGIKVVDLLAPYVKGGKIGELKIHSFFPSKVCAMRTQQTRVSDTPMLIS